MKVAACQLPHIEKDVGHTLSLLESYTSNAEHQGVSLICFPECFLQGYVVTAEHVNEMAVDIKSTAFKIMLQKLKKLKPTIVFGVIERDTGKVYNSAVAVKHGVVLARYRKMHLLNQEKLIFQTGSDHSVFDVQGVKVGINICSDLNYIQSVQRVAQTGASLLVCPCNNMLPRSVAERWKFRHNEIRSERAKEANIWLMSSDVMGETGDRISYGPTAVINPCGQIVEQVPLMREGVVVVEIG
jgi:predicted amidohydrolase